jgi:curved DNA-binding protein CbpA
MPATPSLQGTLRDGGALGAFRDAHLAARTGALRIASVEGPPRDASVTIRVFTLRAGRLVDLDSSSDAESLGGTLARYELVDLEQLASAEREARRTRLPLEAVLRASGVLDDERAAEALATRAAAAVSAVLSARDGAWTFLPAGTVAGHPIELPLGRVLLDALAALEMRDPSAVGRCAGDGARVPRFTGRRVDAVHGVLTPAEAEVARLVDGSRSASEIAKKAGHGAARRLLLGMIATGVLEWTPADEVLAPLEEPAAPVAAAPPPVSRRPAEAKPAVAAPAAARSVPPPDALAAFRADVMEVYAALQTADHFRLLGVDRTATDDEIAKAYAARVKRYHPDMVPDPSLSDLREPLTAVFVAVGEAFNVLRDPARRVEYLARITRHEAQARVRAAAAKDPEAQKIVGEDMAAYVARAEMALLNNHVWDAARILEEVVMAAHGPLKTRAEVLLARAYCSDHRRVRDAERLLHQVVEREPDCVEAFVTLGGLYRDLGMAARARRSYERALSLQPDHAAARKELAGLDEEGGDEPRARPNA